MGDAFNAGSQSDGHKDQLYSMASENLITDGTAITMDIGGDHRCVGI